MKIKLKVPYEQRYDAKDLGAKWDQDERCWFIPSGMDIIPFQQWMESPTSEQGESDDSSQTAKTQDQSLSLSSLMMNVSQGIKKVVPGEYTVKAEISNITRSSTGHMYLDLVEYNDSKREIAKARGVIWARDRDKILKTFLEGTGAELSKGQAILFKSTIDFHPQYHLSLTIKDIDPSYTVGAIEVNKKRIMNALIDEGVDYNNKDLVTPKDFTRIAVLSPKDAAGLGDFKSELDVLNKYNICKVDYYTSLFQGELAKTGIVEQFIKIQDSKIKYDAVIFIRGGGSITDLNFLNEYEIAKALVETKIPVFTGIGHQKDINIPDMLANLSFDTPSKVALYIKSTILENAINAKNDFEYVYGYIFNAMPDALSGVKSLMNITKTTIRKSLEIDAQAISQHHKNVISKTTARAQNATLELDSLINTTKEKTKASIEMEAQRIYQKQKDIISKTKTQLAKSEYELLIMKKSVSSSINNRLTKEKSVLKQFMQISINNSPSKIMGKGYCYIKQKGKFISSKYDIMPNNSIKIHFNDSTVRASIVVDGEY